VAVGDRRLVVGLTPAGMVSLADCDADDSKKPATEAETSLGGESATRTRGCGHGFAAG